MCEVNNMYQVSFSEEELKAIHAVFLQLTDNSLNRWKALLPQKGCPLSQECRDQWRITGIYENIMNTAATPLGLSVREDL